ncbi:MAG: hypothetical protein JNK48_32090 [Bryobacterales bacterium]|nr:hypothetical protein [Bryobacterales bacterium]
MPGNDWLSDRETWLSALTWLGLLLAAAGCYRRRYRVAAAGVVCLAAGWGVPPEMRKAAFVETRLDELRPTFQFQEWHYRHMRAPQHVVWRKMRSHWLIGSALRAGFRIAEEAEGCELVLAKQVFPPAEAYMNILLEPTNRGTTVVSTETRVYAESAWAAHRFAVYWRVIYPGSAALRMALLWAMEAK